MAKLLKLRRGTTTQHGSFTGAEGEVTVDTDKETLVVHDGSTAGGHPVAAEDMANVSSASIAGRLSNDSIAVGKIAAGTLPSDVKIQDANVSGNLTIESADIVDGTIVNADVNASAAIAGTKISPDFGSQDVTTTGNIVLDSNSNKIKLGDGQELQISHNGGNSIITDTAHPVFVKGNQVHLQSANGNMVSCYQDAQTELFFNEQKKLATTSGGIDVTGNIAVSGTVDGVDIAAIGVSNGAIASATTATTQSASDNSTKVATTAYVDTAVTNLVDSAPSALNTLNELAAAIGDDANFSTTVTNSIATKMPLAGGEFTGNVTCENITPDGDSSRNLGSNSVRFANVYADNFVGSGANLTGVEAFVSGMIILWSGNTGNIPSGFVLCNGSNSTPDLRDRFVVGAGSSYNPGNTGGSASVTLSTTQIPSHNHTTPNHRHSFSGSTNNDTHSHTWDRQDAANDQGYRPWPASNNDCRRTTANTGNDTHNHSFSGNTGYHQGTTTSTGSGSSHENRPPYYALCYIMKT